MSKSNTDEKFYWWLIFYLLLLGFVLSIRVNKEREYIFSPENESRAVKPIKNESEQFYYNSNDIVGGYSESGYVKISEWGRVLKTTKSVLQIDENSVVITFTNNQRRKCEKLTQAYYCKPVNEVELDMLKKISKTRQTLPTIYESW